MHQCHCDRHIGQRPEGSQLRPRRCLLKGCERLFWPQRPQTRYCSEECRREARRWRRWQASQRYRASAGGRQRRRQQSQRYRQRVRERPSAAAAAATAREGQRQRLGLKIWRRGPASGRAVTNFSAVPMTIRVSVFAAWRAARRYVACWIARRVIGHGVGAGVGSG